MPETPVQMSWSHYRTLLQVDEGVESLTTLKDKIDTSKMNKPSFLMVLTGVGDIAYRRDDEIYVVPVGCLKP